MSFKNKDKFTVLSEEELKAYRLKQSQPKRTFNTNRAKVGAIIGASVGLAAVLVTKHVQNDRKNDSKK